MTTRLAMPLIPYSINTTSSTMLEAIILAAVVVIVTTTAAAAANTETYTTNTTFSTEINTNYNAIYPYNTNPILYYA